MKRLFPRVANPQQQSGFYFVLAAFLLVALLALATLVVEGARLFLHKQRLTRAADMGALSGTFLARKGYPESQVEQMAKNLAIDNLAWNGVAAVNQVVDADFNPNSGRVNVKVVVGLPLLLGEFLGFVQPIPLESTAMGEVGSLAVVLILDRSGSMGTGHPDGEYECLEDGPVQEVTGSCNPEGLCRCQKISALKVAVINFIAGLSLADDVGVVWYSNSKSLERSLTAPWGSPQKSALIDSIATKTASGGTCISCGEKAAEDDIKNYFASGKDKPLYIILMTDGMSNYPPATSPTYPLQCFQNDNNSSPSAYQSVQGADRLRGLVSPINKKGPTIYTIGLGDPSSISSHMLKVLANDSSIDAGSFYPLLPTIVPPPDPINCVGRETEDECACLVRRGNGTEYPKGEYRETNDPPELSNIFQGILEKIRTPRLIK